MVAQCDPEPSEGAGAIVRSDGVDAYWSDFLGVGASALRTPGTTVVPHHRLGEYRGVWFFTRGPAVVISAPRELRSWLSADVAGFPAGRFSDPVQIGEVFQGFPHRLVGPSYQGWLPPGHLVPEPGGDVRRVETAEPFVEAIRAGCTDEEWGQSGIDPFSGDTWVGFQDQHPVALGQLRERVGACDPCLVTHRGYRGRGCGTRVVSAMLTEAEAAAEKLVLYQTLMSNAGGVAIARKLGFQQYATLIAVRLGEDAA